MKDIKAIGLCGNFLAGTPFPWVSNKGPSRNDVIFLGEGMGVDQNMTKGDWGEGGVSQKMMLLSKKDDGLLHKGQPKDDERWLGEGGVSKQKDDSILDF